MSVMPYYRRYPSDFIAGTTNLSLEMAGMYSYLIDLMYDRGVPLPYDKVWLGRVAGCSTRRAGILIDALIALGKVKLTADGNLTHPRVEADIAAYRRKTGDKSEINARKIEDKSEINRGEVGENNDLDTPLNQKPETRSQKSSTDSPTESQPSSSNRASDVGPEDCDHVVATWNAMAAEKGLPQVRLATGQRKNKLRSRIASAGLPAVLEAIQRVGESPFCLGDNDRGWRADLDFLLQDKSFTRLLEGSFARHQPDAKASGTGNASLTLLRSINGGKQQQEAAAADDPWGIDAFCQADEGVKSVEATDKNPSPAGRWGYSGRYFDVAAKTIGSAARISRQVRVDWSPLKAWIDAGIRTEDIANTISRMAQHFNDRGDLPSNLRPYDKAILEKRAA